MRTLAGVLGLLTLLGVAVLGCAGSTPTSTPGEVAQVWYGATSGVSPSPGALLPTPSSGIRTALPRLSPSTPAGDSTRANPTSDISPRQPSATATLEPTPTPTATPTPTPIPTPTPTPTPLVFAVAGDSRAGPAVYRAVLQAVRADGSQFLIHTGDLVNRGTEAEFAAFAQIMEGFELPFFPVAGNHDAQAGDLTWFLRYSGAPAAHYSLDRGLVHLTLADSHHGVLPPAELQWIEQDLAQSSQPVKIVALHHPPYDPDGSNHILGGGNQAFMDLMRQEGVDYVFCGHIHAFVMEEREGTVYVITGGAGAPLYREGHAQAFHHYVRVSVGTGSSGELKVDVEAVPVSP